MKYQIAQRFNALNRIGESKHQAKQDFRRASENAKVSWNPAQADGIFSIKTMEGYRQTAGEFSAWLKENHPDIKDINAVSRQHAIAYLQQRQDKGLSPWTVSKDMSALNKVFNLNVSKKDAGLQERSYKNTTRSRVERSHDRQYNPKNYSQQITFAQAFGCRRESIVGGQYQVKDMSLFRYNGKIYASFIEKGGRYREAPCLRSMQPTIEKMIPNIQERELTPLKDLQTIGKHNFQELYQQSSQYLFERYTTKIDNHAFRHQYARELTQEINEALNHPEGALYRGYNKEILRQVSEALGHSRLSVVVEHYLR